MRAKIVQEEISHSNITFSALRIETGNANVLFLSETEDQLGTLAVAMPPTERMIGPPVSSILLGDRNTMIARMIAERLAHKTGKIALASVFTKLGDQDTATSLLKLFDKTFEQKEETDKK